MGSQPAERRLPIGIQTFREIRNDGYLYVDKTGFALQLVAAGKYYFLSRPRRFGKSLFLNTFKDLFDGRRELFQGLEAYDRWDWSVRHPVVGLSFGRGNYIQPDQLEVDLMAQLDGVERQSGVTSRYKAGPQRLADLLETLHLQHRRRVVVLVDEYDKPILDTLHKPTISEANRDSLRSVYSGIKDCDTHVRFCFLTGVSKFSRVSLFSGLNNLIDITLDPAVSSICGYTERDLDEVFGDELAGLDRERIRDWYSGYSWGGAEKVYNPFDVLLLLRMREFKHWWYETGTPTFLIRQLADSGIPWHRLDGMWASDRQFSTFDVGRIAPEALLFQTGYLTVVEREALDDGVSYRLGYPNREVRQGLNQSLLDDLVGTGWQREQEKRRLIRALRTSDLADLEVLVHSLLAGIPHEWHGRNPMVVYEGFYASVLYAHFSATGAEVRAEESGSIGRADLCVRAFGHVYVFEFKMKSRGGAAAAMAQLKARGYADRYRGLGEPIHLVAVEFSPETRNVTRFEVETV